MPASIDSQRCFQSIQLFFRIPTCRDDYDASETATIFDRSVTCVRDTDTSTQDTAGIADSRHSKHTDSTDKETQTQTHRHTDTQFVTQSHTAQEVHPPLDCIEASVLASQHPTIDWSAANNNNTVFSCKSFLILWLDELWHYRRLLQTLADHPKQRPRAAYLNTASQTASMDPSGMVVRLPDDTGKQSLWRKSNTSWTEDRRCKDLFELCVAAACFQTWLRRV